MKSHSLIHTLILFLTSSLIMAQSTLSLEQILKQGRELSLAYHEASVSKKIVQLNDDLFKAGMKPQLNLNINAPNFFKTSREVVQPNGSIIFQPLSQNYSTVSLTGSQFIPQTGGSVFFYSDLQRFDDFNLNDRLYNGIPLRVGITQPIFGFNSYKYDKVIQPLSLEVAEKQFNYDIEGIHLQVVDLYFDALSAQANLEIAQTNLDINQKLIEIARERYALGKISENDLLQLQLELNGARKSILRADIVTKNAAQQLYTFLRQEIDLDTEFPSFSIPSSPTSLGIDKSLLLIEARKNRPEISGLILEAARLEKELSRTSNENGIQVGLFASLGLARGSRNLESIYSDPITEQQVSLSVSIPVLDWGKRKKSMQIIKEQQSLLHERSLTLDQQIESLLNQKIMFLEELEEEISLQKEITEVSEKRFSISQQRYVLGDISITDLTLAQREKDQSKRDFINTLRDYWTTYYEVRQMSGFDFIENKKITY